MQTIFNGIDLNEDIEQNSQNSRLTKLHCCDMPYKERSMFEVRKMLTEKFKNVFTSQQIETIIKIYFDFDNYMCSQHHEVIRGVNRTFIVAGATFIVCDNIERVCELFPEITSREDHKEKIVKYSLLIKSKIPENDYYDDASRELAQNSP